MITTQDNLANALAEGRITQEEYNEYYPYDGLENSYYSVFVETDLNTAGTTSGQPLRSEDAIASEVDRVFQTLFRIQHEVECPVKRDMCSGIHAPGF